MKCKYCGGQGMTKLDPTYCKHCDTYAGGRKNVLQGTPALENDNSRMGVPTLTNNPEITNNNSLLNKETPLNYKDIPSIYLKDFDIKAFELDTKTKFPKLDSTIFKAMLQNMSDILATTERGGLMKKSVVFQLMEDYHTNSFFYQLIKNCQKRGISYNPLITLIELTYLVNSRNYHLDNLLNADYCFLSLPRIQITDDEMKILAFILNTRGQKGKVTLITCPVAVANWFTLFPKYWESSISICNPRDINSPTFKYDTSMLIPAPISSNFYWNRTT